MAHIEIETPDGTKRVALDRDQLSIGRLSHNDVVVSSAQISRQHAEIRRTSDGWRIVDMHSTNGIQHKGARIQESRLSNGDTFLLAPGITVTFFDDVAHPAVGPSPAASGDGHSGWGQRLGSNPAGQASTAQSYPFRTSPSSPEHRAGALASNSAFVPPTSIAPLKPRSIYADDEVPYAPPAMAARAPVQTPPAGPHVSGAPVPGFSRQSFGPDRSAPGVPSRGMPPQGPPPAPKPVASGQILPGGYPAPLGPMVPGSDAHDLYHRSSGGPALQGRSTSGPAATLLHVCQTCGQLTDPSATYCQSCHHTIAQECFNCRLSLLPIQDRCPRCHTPNVASVRRRNAHRAGA